MANLYKSVFQVTIIHTDAEDVSVAALIRGGESRAEHCQRIYHRPVKAGEEQKEIQATKEGA